MLKFSPANTKIKRLAKVKAIKPFLTDKRKVYSLDLLSGYSCPYANECLSKVEVIGKSGKRINIFRKSFRWLKTFKRRIVDGPNTMFRCFSASQEALFPAVFNMRKHNFDYLRNLCKDNDYAMMAVIIESQLPKNLGVLRIHVGGDFFSQTYFDAMRLVAKRNPKILFYAYTKSLKFWVKSILSIPDNFVLTASRGGRSDELIEKMGLRSVVVVADPIVCEKVAKLKHQKRMPKLGMPYDGFPIDSDDSHAADPSRRNQDFALLIHGTQPKDSASGKALRSLKGIGSYGAKK